VTLSDRVIIPPQIITKTVSDETVIVDLMTGTYFGLDPVGARIWQLMHENKTLAEICSVMLEEYEVSRAELEYDTMKLVEALSEQGLISQGDL